MALGMLAERCYPYALGISIGVAVWHFGVTPSPAKFDSMLSSAISVTAIILGFLGTAKAMLLSLRSNKFAWLKSKPRMWEVVLGYFKVALVTNFFVCILSLLLIGMTVDQMPEQASRYIGPAWIGIFVIAVASFYRVVSVLFTLLRSE